MVSTHKLHEAICRRRWKKWLNMFWKCNKRAETPRFRRPRPWKYDEWISSPSGQLYYQQAMAGVARRDIKHRPCLADGKPATFHRWVEEDQALLQIHHFMRPVDQEKIVARFREEGVIDNSATIERLRNCFALIEYQDGSMGKVKPELLQFIDVCTVPPAAEGP